MVNDGANDYFYLHDHLYSTVALVNSAGAVVERYEYDAYGKVSILSPNYELRTTSSLANPYLFAGYRFDANTKLYHTLYRSYDPYTGRWLQHDPLDYIDSMSLYEYVMSNPTGYTDPWGLFNNSEFNETIEQTQQAYVQVQEALQQLGVMALNGNCSESELYAQVAAIEGLYNQYQSQQNALMSSVNEIMGGNWWWLFSGESRRLIDAAYNLSFKEDPAGGLINANSELLAEAFEIACSLNSSCAKTANSTQMTFSVVHGTETVLTVASAAGGVTLIGQQAVKLAVKEGGKAGMKAAAVYLAKQAAVAGATQIAATLIVDEAEQLGFSETQIRAGMAAFEMLAMYKAFQGKKGCAKIKEGIYEFPDAKAQGKPYVGQSENIPNRLKQHINSGKLSPNSKPKTTSVVGGKTAREIKEHKRIQQLTGGVPAKQSDKVSNKKDPIGPNRRHLLDE